MNHYEQRSLKMRYKIANWPEYNKSLINRGRITFWFSEDVVKGWINQSLTHKKGRPEVYADAAVLCAMILKSIYHLTYRSLQGFITDIIFLLSLKLPIPSYTQLCRRAAKLSLPIFDRKKVTDIVVDASGLKIFGEGEWLVKKHGKSKRRRWRKLHLAIDPNTHEIVMSSLTDGHVADCKEFPKLIKKLEGIKRVYGDGGYDTKTCHEKIIGKGAEPIIPPRRRGRLNEPPWAAKRNKAILEIMGLGNDDVGRSTWKKLKGYHKRSLVETAFSRYKRMLGGDLYSRKMESQEIESQIKCLVLNKMTKLGMPLYRGV